jgi:glyoxylase-like metal-dependent hydrolase (beta-lactamase superfamily II)
MSSTPNPGELELCYPLGDELPASGQTIEVSSGVRWIRMGLPFALNHINLWLLRDCIDGVEGWSVVDCCIDKPESRAQWEAVFAAQLQGLPILRIIVTHMHPDHVGLAHWLCERWAAPLWMSSTDYNAARIASASTTGFGGAASATFFESHGLSDPDSVAKIKARTSYFPSMVPAMPPRYRRMMDGDTIAIGGREWRCISGYGHAPEHISLVRAASEQQAIRKPGMPPSVMDDTHPSVMDNTHPCVMISGDMMLPRISTNVSVYDIEPEGDPLRLFLSSIDKFAHLPENTLVLPSHGKPFTGLHARIRQLHTHHQDRLAEVMVACAAAPCSGADIVPIMFKRELDLHQMTFAMGEAVAHLHLLWFEGRLSRSLDSDGVYRFSVA